MTTITLFYSCYFQVTLYYEINRMKYDTKKELPYLAALSYNYGLILNQITQLTKYVESVQPLWLLMYQDQK